MADSCCVATVSLNSISLTRTTGLRRVGFFFFLALLTYLQEWTGSFFRKESLRNLGLKIQLGHYPGDTCTSPQRSTRPFTVIHSNGIHQVDVLFCGCNLAARHGDRVQQLLRRRLFPSTTTDPQSASTFAVLEYAHILSVQSKLSLYDYYESVEILTDATRVSGIKVCVWNNYPLPFASNNTKGSLPGISSNAQNVAPSASLETRREGPRSDRCPGYIPRRTRSVVPRLPLSEYQPPG